jgi:AhpD family alkylhydroperoxidase
MTSTPQATVCDSAALSDAGIPPTRPRTAKRTLNRGNTFKTVASGLISTPVMLRALVRPKISAALREKLFLAVSAINDCRLCKWGHTHWAIAKGVPLEEVNQILGLQTESLAANNPSEASAILFAQHYAEQLDKFDPESIENLRQYYNDPEVAEILAYVHFITLANLTGNTVDAFLTRAQSRGSRCIETAVAAVAAPVTLLLTQLAKLNSPVELEELRSSPHATASPDSDAKQASR